MRWWAAAARSEGIAHWVKADILQTHVTLWLQGENLLLGVNKLTLPCGRSKLPPHQTGFLGHDRFLVGQSDIAVLQLRTVGRGDGIRVESARSKAGVLNMGISI